MGRHFYQSLILATKPAVVYHIHLKLSLLLLLFSSTLVAQKKGATVSGKIIGENESVLSNVSVSLLGHQRGIKSTDSGTFRIKVPSDKAFALE